MENLVHYYFYSKNKRNKPQKGRGRRGQSGEAAQPLAAVGGLREP